MEFNLKTDKLSVKEAVNLLYQKQEIIGYIFENENGGIIIPVGNFYLDLYAEESAPITYFNQDELYDELENWDDVEFFKVSYKDLNITIKQNS